MDVRAVSVYVIKLDNYYNKHLNSQHTELIDPQFYLMY